MNRIAASVPRAMVRARLPGSCCLLLLALLAGYAHAGTPTPMASASRSSGVAPLAVFFDVSDAASAVVQPADGNHNRLHYQWDFGDPGAGQWDLGSGQSRNLDIGYVTGHVYTEPGSYTVTLEVTDAQGGHYLYQQLIEVQSPATAGWMTYYVSSSTGNDGNNGSQAAPFASIARGLAEAGPNRRILLRRGDLWNLSEHLLINANGPTVLGAYGSGAKPRLRFTTSQGILFGWATDNRDWRLIDLRLEGPEGSSVAIVSEGSKIKQGLFMGLEVEHWGSGVVLSNTCNTYDELAFVGNRVREIPRNWGLYTSAHRGFIKGNHIEKTRAVVTSHSFRLTCAQRVAVGHNYVGPAHHSSLKFHSSGTSASARSERVVINDNIFEGSVYTVAIAPQDVGSNELVRDVLFENNVLHARRGEPGAVHQEHGLMPTSEQLHLVARNVEIRNNLFLAVDPELNQSLIAVNMLSYGNVSPADSRVLHNTFHRINSGQYSVAWVRAGVAGAQLRNNLVAAPNSQPVVLVSLAPGVSAAHSHNARVDAPGFIDAAAGDYRLSPASPPSVVDAGMSGIQVMYDRAGWRRDGAPDLGAYELQSDLIFAHGFED